VTLTPIYTGKVCDIYDAGGGRQLHVRTDRTSVFDVVLPQQVQDRGKVLTEISNFWLDLYPDVPRAHLPYGRPEKFSSIPDLAYRSTLMRVAEMLKIECIVRGYLTGSGLKEYKRDGGQLCGIQLPDGLVEASQLPEPIFTPSTKAESGHDENISFKAAVDIIEAQFPGRGMELVTRAKLISLDLYRRAAAHARERGIIIADTKFEFGLIDGELVLCDEVLTPDSSRFWPAELWVPGQSTPSFDKQILRDVYQALYDEGKWDKKYPAPEVDQKHFELTRERYIEGFVRLTGSKPEFLKAA
jgi:phosphoribosylaminoimidazole-succinocarboxamide synthase